MSYLNIEKVKNYPNNYKYDLELSKYKNKCIIGVDEAGRGSLAGPVVIAGVIIDYGDIIDGITDSKKLSVKKREKLYDTIIEKYKHHIAVIPVETIDSINILNATIKGTEECLKVLYDYYEIAILDSIKVSIKDRKIHSIVKADLMSAGVGAASILAKVYRDNILRGLAKEYPNYSLEKNKGYPTKEHREALIKFGATEIHRKSYAPVKAVLDKDKKPKQSDMFN